MKNYKKMSRMIIMIMVTLITSTVAAPAIIQVFSVPPPAPVLMDPNLIPKFTEPLLIPPVYEPTQVSSNAEYYEISMATGLQQILPTVDALGNPTGYPLTPIWGYKGNVVGQTTPWISAPGATFEATKGKEIYVKWTNNINDPHMFPVDPSLHWADPNGLDYAMNPPSTWNTYPPGYTDAQEPVPLIPHLHGGEVQSTSDGHPEAWFTNGTGVSNQGPKYNSEVIPGWLTGITVGSNEALFRYPNAQPTTTLWYHDHALGITRINVMSGLAGFYLLRDPADTNVLPSGQYDVPIVLQDRSFNPDGTFWFPNVGVNIDKHPYWQPEFFGNTIMVNGKTWPYFDVDPTIYRIRLLDGSNARFYDLKLVDPLTGLAYPFYQIGTDGGYLKAPVKMNKVTIAPGERMDLLFDFRTFAAGTKLVLMNSGKTPYPNGVNPDANTRLIMEFRVTGNTPGQGSITVIPTNINNPSLVGNTWPTISYTPAPSTTRYITLTEVMGPLGPLEALLNGQKWMTMHYNKPTSGSTEEWVIINLTGDTHPIHLHLVQFQLVSRQSINAAKYSTAWMAANAGGSTNGMPPWDNAWDVQEVDPTPYLKGKASRPNPNEMGWKDTVQMNPGEVTTIRVRFAPIDGGNYPFDETAGPGYVWHCHILDHEDNEMMLPYLVVP